MFVATNRITIRPGHESELEERFAATGGVAGQPGFLGFELCKRTWSPHSEPDESQEYLVYTRWESARAHEAWTRSDAFKQAHSGERPEWMLGGEPAGYEVVLTR